MKHYFAPIPNRALIDERVTGRKLKIMGVIAAHDRMGRNGRHCTLSVRRIGEKLGIDFSNVRKDIRDLIDWGYLNRLQHPTHKQRWQLAVAYDDTADLAVVRANRGSQQPQSDTGTVVVSNPTEDINPKVYRRYSVETAQSSVPADCAPPLSAADCAKRDGLGKEPSQEEADATFLRRLDAAVKAGHRLGPDAEEPIIARLEGIHNAYEYDSPLGGWAYRLLQDHGLGEMFG